MTGLQSFNVLKKMYLEDKYLNYLSLIQLAKEKQVQVLWETENLVIDVDTQIIIEPHRETYVCAITGKISTEAVKIGEAWISKDGIKRLIEYMDQ